MAYELHKDPLDMVSDILDKYRRKVAILKCDVHCRRGTLLKDSIVCIEINKTKISENKAEIEIKIYDCSERNNLEEYDPYKIQDIFTINAESNGELINVLESLFVVNDEKTKYHEEYALLRQKVRNYNINEECISDFTKGIVGLSAIAFTIVLMIDMSCNYDCSKYEIILSAIMLIFWSIKIFARFVIVHKTRGFKEIADKIHVKIIEEKIQEEAEYAKQCREEQAEND